MMRKILYMLISCFLISNAVYAGNIEADIWENSLKNCIPAKFEQSIMYDNQQNFQKYGKEIVGYKDGMCKIVFFSASWDEKIKANAYNANTCSISKNTLSKLSKKDLRKFDENSKLCIWE